MLQSTKENISWTLTIVIMFTLVALGFKLTIMPEIPLWFALILLWSPPLFMILTVICTGIVYCFYYSIMWILNKIWS
jgi:uncharacterized membrane protein YhdT